MGGSVADSTSVTHTVFKSIVRVGKVFYDIEDPCIKCGHAFECTEDGKTKASAYPQMSTLSLRGCVYCGEIQKWTLRKGKQPWLHKVNDELLEDDGG